MKRISLIALLILTLTNTFITPSSRCEATEDNKPKEEAAYNYGEALQKSIMFYEFQRSGKLPEEKRENWRADSGMNDGSDVGVDLTGGWYDAGDHLKFNLPMSYSAAMLAWSVYEDKDAYEKSGQLKYIMDAIKWANDYLIKCSPKKGLYYYQVGEPGADHKWWGAPEVMQMDRPTYTLDAEHPGSAVTAESAASLAAAATIFKDSDKEYSDLCLQHAKDLFEFADETRSDKGYTKADTYYSSGSFYDDLSFAATWLYIATGDKEYLDKAESYVPEWGVEQQTSIISYRWGHCWDDVHYGTQILLARLTGKDIYKESAERNLDWWTTGYDAGYGINRIQYTPDGLAWLMQWGPLRYSTTTAFLAGIYSEWEGCPADKAKTYKEFLESQTNYALGSTGRSYVVGFGENAPKSPHHRGSQASWFDQKKVPAYNRHVLYGALVGGPNLQGKYVDDVEDFQANEVACDYNAGFVGALAKMYKAHGGNPIKDFKSIEEKTNDEFYVEARVNAKDKNFIEIKAYLYNKSGWPAKVGDKLSFRYFMDLSELYEAGFTKDDLKITTNYNDGAKMSEVLPWDEKNHIYYVIADFTGTKIYPGGQSDYRKEVQFRIAAPAETNFWDNSNDFSFEGIPTSSEEDPKQTENIPVYDDGGLVYGKTPIGGQTLVTLGDVNGDGNVDMLDYVKLKMFLSKKDKKIVKNAADLDQDGLVTVKDLLVLRQLV